MHYRTYSRSDICEVRGARSVDLRAAAPRLVASIICRTAILALISCCLDVSAFGQLSDITWERVDGAVLDGYPSIIAHAEAVEDARPALADIDADGDSDLFVGTASGEILLLQNQGSAQSPAWNLASSQYHGIQLGEYAAPILTDIDSDGDLDLFVSGSSSGSIRFYANTGTATRAAWALVATNYAGAVGIPRFVDIDGDGDQDLFTTPQFGFGVSFVENTGTPSFAEWTTPTNHALGTLFNMNARLAFEDLDNDGDLDVLGGTPGGTLQYAENIGSATADQWSATVSNYAGVSFGTQAPAPYFDDVDQDGDPDLFVGRSSGGVDFFENIGSVTTAVWGGRKSHLNTLDFGRGTSVKPSFGDMDGDGDFDMLTVTRFGEVSLLENVGSPLSPHWLRKDASGHQFITSTNCAPAFGDIDGDGDDDLFIGQQNGSVVFFENLASTSAFFQLAPAVSNYAGSSFNTWNVPKLIDADSDGDLDMFLGLNFGTLVYYENGGTPTQAQWVAPPVSYSNSFLSLNQNSQFAAGDPDGDGDIDFFQGLIKIPFPPPGIYDIEAIENIGSPVSPAWIPAVSMGFDFGFAVGITQPTLVDIDGDGDQDMYAGTFDGDLLFWKNQQATLTVSPPIRTVVANEQIDFDVSGTPFEFWDFVTNRSGGFLDFSNGVYTAGTNAPSLDVIGVQGFSGLVGRAYVNVIRPEDAAAAGKAIIVAGGKSLSDPVWDATDLLADKAYRTLLHRGFSKENIHYLSFEPGQDVDGDGLDNDIAGPSTLTAVEQAFTNFARQTDKLFVYLVDHGADSGGQGFMRLDASDILSATAVDQWLDDLQTAHPGLCVNVALDFCYAGSFLDELTAPTSVVRSVMAATTADQLTYFIAGGLVSFSDAFLTSLQIGHTFGEAFEIARAAMSTYQSAEMDDNGDGVFSSGVDGLASTNQLGASFIAGLDMPQIGGVSPNQTISSGSDATVWAESISAAYPVERVWCLIVPPSHDPDTSSAIPVINIPQMDLAQSISDPSRYEATFDGFTEPGTYKVIFLAQDIWGNVSIPQQSYITQGGFEDRAILVAGSTSFEADTNLDFLVSSAYQTLRARLYDHEDIFLMRDGVLDADGDGSNDVDSVSNVGELSNAITNWAASADRLSLFFIGTGSNATFRMHLISTLDASSLDTMLDQFQVQDREVNVVLECADAANFATNLVPPPGRSRIVVASTHHPDQSLQAYGGLVSFTQYFLSEVFLGRTIGDAYTMARRTIRRVSGMAKQEAGIDDDGDGILNEKNVDGAYARTRYLGAAFATGDDAPHIGQVMPPTGLTNGTSLTIWAADVTDVDGISNVWCIITPPGYDGGPLPRVDLSYNEASQRYESPYNGFTQPGRCVLTFYASDSNGLISAAVQSEVVKPDQYEHDDLIAFATPIDIGDPQLHTFHDSTDEDWVMFLAATSHPYTIETLHESTNIDTVIDVYFQEPGGALVLIDHVDSSGFEGGETTGLDRPPSGLYYIRISQYIAPGSAPGSYELSVFIPSGGVPNYGIGGLNLLTGGPLPTGSYAVINGATHYFNNELWIETPLSSGTYTIEVFCGETGFLPLEDKNIPGQVQNIYNEDYGNPRIKEVEDTIGNGNIGALFLFIPHVDVSAMVRDGWTDAPVGGCEVAFGALEGRYSVTSGVHFLGYPFYASYQTPWLTNPDGSFPSPMLVPATDVVMRVRGSDYHDYYSGTAVSNLASGDGVDAGLIQLTPVDSNSNQIADSWETLHYGEGVTAVPSEDDDEDGHSNREEYLLGTDPFSDGDVLASQLPTWNGSGITLRWLVEPGRTYRIASCDDLEAGEWVTRGGPWQAENGQLEMEWMDPDIDGSAGRCYRIEVLLPTM